MFEKASELRARYREQAERRAVERGIKQGIERGREQGMKQGIERGMKQGIERGREQARTRREEALDRFGIEVNGVRALPDTPEVQRFLDGEED